MLLAALIPSCSFSAPFTTTTQATGAFHNALGRSGVPFNSSDNGFPVRPSNDAQTKDANSLSEDDSKGFNAKELAQANPDFFWSFCFFLAPPPFFFCLANKLVEEKDNCGKSQYDGGTLFVTVLKDVNATDSCKFSKNRVEVERSGTSDPVFMLFLNSKHKYTLSNYVS
mmetsp:Transcript_36993/g.54127  ORF Transcript_36993/g.54127 Transcript_36993/m.54127 type:complete len:169 (-) Transcript_36993:27-533(-)